MLRVLRNNYRFTPKEYYRSSLATGFATAINSGFVGTSNSGIALCTGRYFGLFNAPRPNTVGAINILPLLGQLRCLSLTSSFSGKYRNEKVKLRLNSDRNPVKRFNNPWPREVPLTTGSISERLDAMGFKHNRFTLRKVYLPGTGGRDWRGRRVSRRAGGTRRDYRMLELRRDCNEDGTTRDMRVVKLEYDAFRTANNALVVYADEKRRVVATTSMRVGDVISNHAYRVDHVVLEPREGDCYPVGMLPPSTTVCQLNITPGGKQVVCKAAGGKATVLRQEGDRVYVRLSSKQDILIDKRCRAVVGQVTNESWRDYEWGSPGIYRQMGFQPRSGLFQKKGGWAGRKIKPPKKVHAYAAHGDGWKKTILPSIQKNVRIKKSTAKAKKSKT